VQMNQRRSNGRSVVVGGGTTSNPYKLISSIQPQPT
jgi:hypothetical protein